MIIHKRMEKNKKLTVSKNIARNKKSSNKKQHSSRFGCLNERLRLYIDQFSRTMFPEPGLKILHVCQHLVGADLRYECQYFVSLRWGRLSLNWPRICRDGLHNDRRQRLCQIDIGNKLGYLVSRRCEFSFQGIFGNLKLT